MRREDVTFRERRPVAAAKEGEFVKIANTVC
jgi:hypothetical protein